MPDTKKEWSFLKKRTKKLLLPGLLTLICAAPELGVVTLTTQPGSALKQSRSDGDPPLMLVGSARLETSPGPAALFVQVQSASFCGSAGCSTSIYLKRGKTWKKVMDSISGPISVAATTHHGMHDLMLHGGDRWVWTGSTYADTLPTPNIDLRHSTKE
jgi:hypothetical protein